MSKSILSLAAALVLGFAGASQANSGCTNCGIASPQGIAPSAQSVVADCGGGCGGKGLSLPHISLPKISLPKVHLPKLVHTTSSEYVLKTKHHFSLVKGGGHGLQHLRRCRSGCCFTSGFRPALIHLGR